MGPRAFQIGLAAALVVGLALRLAVITSPLGEIDGDEAVVGLMARHIAFLGERPVFYWGAPNVRRLDAVSAAALFAVFHRGTLLLKLVPTACCVVAGSFCQRRVGRRLGTAAALATAAYL